MMKERDIKAGWIVSADRMFGMNVLEGQIVMLIDKGQIASAPWWG